jgi:hypothetical protein
MYALIRESGHVVWKKQWYAFSLRVDLYMTQKDQVFIADVVIIDPTREIVASNVISWPTCATVELNTIVKMYKYKGLHEGHHFIQMVIVTDVTVRNQLSNIGVSNNILALEFPIIS